MHCAGCLATIRETLNKLPGVRTVEGDLDRKQVTAKMTKSAASTEVICTALSNIGHMCAKT